MEIINDLSEKLAQLTPSYVEISNRLLILVVIFGIKFIVDSEYSTINIIIISGLILSYLLSCGSVKYAKTVTSRESLNEHKVALSGQNAYLNIGILILVTIFFTKCLYSIYLLFIGTYELNVSTVFIYFSLSIVCISTISDSLQIKSVNKKISKIVKSINKSSQ